MQCPSCNKPLKPDARFCGNCGYQLTEKPASRVKPKDLFSIDINEKSAIDDQNNIDKTDFFEESSNPLTEDSDEGGWIDDRKVFGEEDDPTMKDNKPTKEAKPAKKIDSKTLAKIKAKKQKSTSALGTFFSGIQSLFLFCLISIAPVLIAYGLNDQLYLQIFILLPLALIVVWPFLRKKGLTLNLIVKISNLWYCGALVYLIVLAKKAGLSLELFNQHWNGFLIHVDVWMLFHLYFVFFCQSLVFYLWRSNLHWLLKITPVFVMAYSLIELLVQLRISTGIQNLGGHQNMVSSVLKPFIGDYGLYMSPHFVLTHLFLPLTILTLLIISFLCLLQKKWSQSMSSLLFSLQGLIFISIYLTPYRNLDISSRIFTLGPFIDQAVKTILESIPVII